MKMKGIAFSTNGCGVLLKLKEHFDGFEICCKTKYDTLGLDRITNADEWTRNAFAESDVLVFVGAVGIAVRHIAPYVRSKDSDPAVVCIDEMGTFVIPILSGHIGGGNVAAIRIAKSLGSTPVITTATDIQGRFAVDVFAVSNGLAIERLDMIKETSSRILNGEFVGFVSRDGYEGDLPEGLTDSDSGEFGICVSSDADDRPFGRTVLLIPKDVTLGVGCRRGTDPDMLCDFVFETLDEEGIDPARLGAVVSIDLKSDEPAVLELCKRLNVPPRFLSADELNSMEGEFTTSEFVSGVTGVDCVCERSAVSSGGKLILKKTAKDGMTVAIAKNDITPRFD